MIDNNKRQKGRPPEEKKTQLISIRLGPDILTDLDEIAAEESKRTGYNLDRSQAIRRALVEFIDRFKRERNK